MATRTTRRPMRALPVAMIKTETPDAVRDGIRATFEDVLEPILAAVRELDAATDIEDDAELGRRARGIVRDLARKRIDRELLRRPDAGETTLSAPYLVRS